jgi:hypothetical protein
MSASNQTAQTTDFTQVITQLMPLIGTVLAIFIIIALIKELRGVFR